MDRGYSKKCLKKAYSHAYKQTRTSLLQDKTKQNDSKITRLITTFDIDHMNIRKILSRHWHVLTGDPKIAKFISPKPQITYHKARSLKHILVHGHFQPDYKTDPCKTVGTYPCSTCDYCQYIQIGNSITINGITYKSRHFANCQTKGVIYFFLCSCFVFYIGKTKKCLWQRMRDHISAIKNGNLTYSTARHAAQ